MPLFIFTGSPKLNADADKPTKRLVEKTSDELAAYRLPIVSSVGKSVIKVVDIAIAIWTYCGVACMVSLMAHAHFGSRSPPVPSPNKPNLASQYGSAAVHSEM